MGSQKWILLYRDSQNIIYIIHYPYYILNTICEEMTICEKFTNNG